MESSLLFYENVSLKCSCLVYLTRGWIFAILFTAGSSSSGKGFPLFSELSVHCSEVSVPGICQADLTQPS